MALLMAILFISSSFCGWTPDPILSESCMRKIFIEALAHLRQGGGGVLWGV